MFLSIYRSIYLSIYLSMFWSIYLYLSIYVSIYLSIYLYLSIYRSIYRSIYLSMILSMFLSIYLSISIYLSVYLQAWKRSYLARLPQFFELDNIRSATILQDLFNFWTWQRKKRKQFSETSSIFQVDNIKNKAILRGFLQKWKIECRVDGLVPMRFVVFPLHLPKVSRLPRKSDARSYKVLHLSRKIILANLQIWMLQNATLWGNQRSDLLTSLLTMSLVLRLPRKMPLCRSSSNAPCLPTLLKLLQNPDAFCSLLSRCRIPCACHAKRYLSAQKWSEHVVLLTFWLGNVLRATMACAFWTSQLPKVVLEKVCFVHFWLGNVFPTTTACTFSSSQLPKVVSENGLLCTFWLRHVLRATTACKFLSLIWTDGSAPVALASLPGATNHWIERSQSRLFSFFANLHLLSSDTFSSLLWSSFFFSSLLFFDSSHLCFSICPYCRKIDF